MKAHLFFVLLLIAVPIIAAGQDSLKIKLKGENKYHVTNVKYRDRTSPVDVLGDGVEVGTLSDADTFVNVNDIQSITVDKDGAMYGARGANGVIKISTIASGVVMY